MGLPAHQDRKTGRLSRRERDEIGRIIMSVQPNHVITAGSQFIPDLWGNKGPKSSWLAYARGISEKYRSVSGQQVHIPLHITPKAGIPSTAKRQIRKIERRYIEVMLRIEIRIKRCKILNRMRVDDCN